MIAPICLYINGLGTAYRPDTAGRCPAVMILHGSEGGSAGWSHVVAVMLAARGFLSCPISYSIGGDAWQAGDILRVPIDKTAEALRRLRECDQANAKVGVYGVSRGAEHALLLATLMSQARMDGLPDAVAAHASTDTVQPPFIARSRKPGCVTALGTINPVDESARGPATAWTWFGKSDGLHPGATIEIEHYRGDVFLSHGTADKVWHAAMTERLAERRAATGAPTELHLYQGEGHRLSATAMNRHIGALASFFGRPFG